MRKTIIAAVALSAAMASLLAAGTARATAPGERALAGSTAAFTSHAAISGTVAPGLGRLDGPGDARLDRRGVVKAGHAEHAGGQR